jgi:hypothetical protein
MPVTSGKRRSTPSNVLVLLRQREMSLDLQQTFPTRTCLLHKSSQILSILLLLLNSHSLHLPLLFLPPTLSLNNPTNTLLYLLNPTNTLLLHLPNSVNILLLLHLLHLLNSQALRLCLVYNTTRHHHLTSYLLHHLLSHTNPRPRLSQLNRLHLNHQEPSHASLYATKHPFKHKTMQTIPKICNHPTNPNPKRAPPLQDKKASLNATWKRWVGKRVKVSAKKQQA